MGSVDVKQVFRNGIQKYHKQINNTRDAGQRHHPGQTFSILVNNSSRIEEIYKPHQRRKNKIYGGYQPNHPQRNGLVVLEHKGRYDISDHGTKCGQKTCLKKSVFQTGD